jgi:hypothetical protein
MLGSDRRVLLLNSLSILSSCAVGTGEISLRLKRSEHEARNSPPSRSSVRVVWGFNSSTTYVFISRCFNKANGNYCLYLLRCSYSGHYKFHSVNLL